MFHWSPIFIQAADPFRAVWQRLLSHLVLVLRRGFGGAFQDTFVLAGVLDRHVPSG